MIGERREFLHALANDALAIADEEDRDIAENVRRPARRRHGAAAMRLIVERIRALGSLTGADDAMERQMPTPFIAALSRELESVNAVYRANFARKAHEDVSLPLLRRICTRGVSATLQFTCSTRPRQIAARQRGRLFAVHENFSGSTTRSWTPSVSLERRNSSH